MYVELVYGMPFNPIAYAGSDHRNLGQFSTQIYKFNRYDMHSYALVSLLNSRPLTVTPTYSDPL